MKSKYWRARGILAISDRFWVKSHCILQWALNTGEEGHCVNLKASVMSRASLIQCALYEDVAGSSPRNDNPFHCLPSRLLTCSLASGLLRCTQNRTDDTAKGSCIWGSWGCADCYGTTGKVLLGREQGHGLCLPELLFWQLPQFVSDITCTVMTFCI